MFVWHSVTKQDNESCDLVHDGNIKGWLSSIITENQTMNAIDLHLFKHVHRIIQDNILLTLLEI